LGLILEGGHQRRILSHLIERSIKWRLKVSVDENNLAVTVSVLKGLASIKDGVDPYESEFQRANFVVFLRPVKLVGFTSPVKMKRHHVQVRIALVVMFE
jgi:hypothetical protein